MTQLTPHQALDLARSHQQAGRLTEAEQLYRQVLSQDPRNPHALHLLGVLTGQLGRHETAIEMIRQAIQIKPDEGVFHGNLGEIYRRTGRPDQAIAALRQAIVLNPNLPKAHYNLGVVLQATDRIDEAIAAYRQTLSLSPDWAEVHNNLGNALQATGQLDQAIAAFRQSLTLNPNLAEAHNNLGNALQTKGQLDQAIAAYRSALVLNPDWPDALTNLGIALQAGGQLDQAIALYHRALALNPNLPETHNNLATAFKVQGLLDDAIASFQRASELKPDYAAPQSNLIYTLQFHDRYDSKALLTHAMAWNQRHGFPLRKFIVPHPNDASPNRRLRIGYISPDFSDHVVGWNLLPLLSHHDHGRMEIFCYADMPRPSPMTDKIRACADAWRDITTLNDEKTAELIRQDHINILVDLTLHMPRNRLLVFARKPAPIQLTYLGYCGTTGLDTIDYRFSDPYLDPPDTDLSCYSEKTLRLPRTYWCYQLPGNAPDVSPLPALSAVERPALSGVEGPALSGVEGPALSAVEGSLSKGPSLTAGHITFGCLNNFAKVSSAAMDLWAQILAAVPRSRLILHAIPGNYLNAVRQRFASAGIATNRIEFTPRQPWFDYMRTYHRIDIALDPFPYAGGITTCDALWMGVPIITLRGQTAVGRGGYSILSNLGLPDLVATTPEEYASIAVKMAGDLSRLSQLRATMRQRMRASPLMDASRYAADVESAYRWIWWNWCEKQRTS